MQYLRYTTQTQMKKAFTVRVILGRALKYNCYVIDLSELVMKIAPFGY